jgi:phospholipase C
VHRFYQEQYQIDGGRMDRYTTGSDAVGLTQGYYDTTQLPLYQYLNQTGAPHYVIADHFFEGAFGGSFLNHQFLVAARAPLWEGGALADGSTNDLHSIVGTDGHPNNTYLLHSGPVYPAAGGVKDGALTEAADTSGLCSPPAGSPTPPAGTVCGDYAVNTIQPTSQPFQPGTAATRQLPPVHATNIGDELTGAGVTWAWYSGGWDNADGNVGGLGWTNGSTPGTCTDPLTWAGSVYPNCPNVLFQFHHQPFNYFANYAPGTPGRTHLRDEQDFLAAAADGTLPAVSFVKPLGPENEHPGYTGVEQGEKHLVDLVKAIESGPEAKTTAIVITYDEFGGQWDHVAPPAGNAFGPGTRVPAIIIAQQLAPKRAVDHSTYDTTSILKMIESRYQLAALDSRDAAANDLWKAFRPSVNPLP